MTFLQSLKEWIDARKADTALAEIPVYIPGGTETIDTPFISLVEESSQQVEQDGVIMRGVYQYEITAELVTTPGETAELATAKADYETQRQDFHDILASHLSQRKWQLFEFQDIRLVYYVLQGYLLIQSSDLNGIPVLVIAVKLDKAGVQVSIIEGHIVTNGLIDFKQGLVMVELLLAISEPVLLLKPKIDIMTFLIYVEVEFLQVLFLAENQDGPVLQGTHWYPLGIG